MKRLFKIGCFILCVFFCFSCTQKEKEEPVTPPTKNTLLELLKEVATDYQYTFEDETSLFIEDEHEKGLVAAYIAGDNDTRICYLSYEDEAAALAAYQYDESVFNGNQQASLVGHLEKEDYQIMYSTQTYVDNDIVGATPRVLHTYSILQKNCIVIIVSSDESLSKELLNACEFCYDLVACYQVFLFAFLHVSLYT